MRMKKWNPLIRAVLLIVVVCLLVYGVAAVPKIRSVLAGLTKDAHQHPVILVATGFILPIFGFPLSVFLLAFGANFGGAIGILLTYLMIPCHLCITYVLARFVFHRFAMRLFETETRRLPKVPEHRHAIFSFLFMVTPGLPYTVKNIILSISGVPFSYYFFFGWLVQATMAIPFILAGQIAIRVGPGVLGLIVILVVLVYLIGRRRRSRNDSSI